MAICTFKKEDGTWNIVEGPDEQGGVRLECTTCGRFYPCKKEPLRRINNPKGLHCNPARRKARLSASKVVADAAAKAGKQGKSCPESCLLRATHHRAALIAELNSVIIKAKDQELKTEAMALLAGIMRNELSEEQFKKAIALAVKQALREGRESS